jgi:8-oxo-dGTP pyrophosphatase MutT (NUDIX family)
MEQSLPERSHHRRRLYRRRCCCCFTDRRSFSFRQRHDRCLNTIQQRLHLFHHHDEQPRRYAGLWLPSGGHVEPDEDPKATVVRELAEELNLAAEFVRDGPLFITVTRTVGEDGGHTDVSLWYLLRGDSSRAIEFDRGEFHGVRWFGFDEIPFERSDPHLRRFVAKMRSSLAAQAI